MGVLLTKEQEQEILHTSIVFTDKELEIIFHLLPEDMEVINQNRRLQNRLGFALQLCWIRLTGGSFPNIADVPKYIIEYVAGKLSTTKDVLQGYGNRRQTKNEHFQKICERYNYHSFDDTIRKEIISFTNGELEAGRSPQAIVENVVDLMKLHRWIVPSMWTLEDIVKTCSDEYHDKIYKSIYSQLTQEQITAIDKILNVPQDENSTISILYRLKEPPGNNNPQGAEDVLAKLKVIQEVGIDITQVGLHQNKLKKLAVSYGNISASRLREYKTEKKYAIAAVILADLELSLTDMVIDICCKIVQGVKSDGTKALNKRYSEEGPKMQKDLRFSINVFKQLLELAHTVDLQGKDWRELLLNIISGKEMDSFMEDANKITSSSSDYIELIEGSFKKFRSFGPAFLEQLQFGTDISETKSLLDGIAGMKDFYRSSRKKMKSDMATAFMEKKWKKYLYNDKGEINIHYYELAFFSALSLAVQSNSLYVEKSYRYKSLNQDLISKEEFKDLPDTAEETLKVPSSFEKYKKNRMKAMIKAVGELVTTLKESQDVYIDKQEIHLKRLKKSVPESAKKLSAELYSRMPQIRLPELMFEVDKWVDFLTPILESGLHHHIKGSDKVAIMGSLMSLGTNLGPDRLAKSSSGISYSELLSAISSYMKEEALKKAQARLVNFQHRQKMAQNWGTGRTSSSDGMRVEYGVNSLIADYNPHFGSNKGATFYRYTLDQYATYFVKIIYANSRDARYMLDGLLEHDSDIEINEHYTDTAGYTDQVFALCHLLGFMFAPRIKNISSSVLYKIDDNCVNGLDGVAFKKADLNVIEENYDEIRRIAYSVKKGYVSSSIVLSKLTDKSKRNALARALQEMGRIEKTIFLLQYFADETLRRKVLIGLNKGEAVNGLGRTLFYGRDRKLRKKDIMGQNIIAMALNILINVICIWNTKYLELAYEDLCKTKEVDKSLLAHVSPLNWSHIIYQGEYRFDPETALEENQYRDLVSVIRER